MNSGHMGVMDGHASHLSQKLLRLHAGIQEWEQKYITHHKRQNASQNKDNALLKTLQRVFNY